MVNPKLIAEALGGSKKTSNGYQCRCPAHDDTNSSLSLRQAEDGTLLWNCKAGCSQSDVLATFRARGLLETSNNISMNTNKNQSWHVCDPDGTFVAEHIRFDKDDGSKVVYWKPALKDIGRKLRNMPLYRSHLIGDAKEAIVGEGEKTTDAAVRLGLDAVGTVCGASTIPSDESLKVLEGKLVTLWPDNDAPGREHMRRIGERLKKLGIEYRIIEWPGAPSKGDAADFIAQGGTLKEFMEFPEIELKRQEKKSQEKRKPAQNKVRAPITGHKLTDMGNGMRFARKWRDKVKYCPPKKKWLTWKKNRWAWDTTGEIVQLAKETVREIYKEAAHCKNKEQREAIATWAHKSESKQRIDAMIALAQTEDEIPVLPHELDPNPYLLGVENGVLDLRTGTLIQPMPEQLITKSTGVHFDPNVQNKLWDKCLRQWTGGDGELIDYLQRVAGLALLGEWRVKSFWFLYGKADAGKSAYLIALAGAFGEYAESTTAATWLHRKDVGGNRGDLVSLMGKRLVFASEFKKGSVFDEEIVKRVTGGDPLTAAAKYEAEITYKPSFVLIFAANDAPIIRDDDSGMWSRVRRVPFTHIIRKEEQDPQIGIKLSAPDVKSAILKWAVDGFLAWQKYGLSACKTVEDSNTKYRLEMDRLEGFITECCEFDPYYKCTVKALKNSYLEWAESEGVKPLGAKDFNQRLIEKGCEQHRVNGQKGWWYIRVKENDYDDLNGDSSASTKAHSDSLFNRGSLQ